MTAPLGPNRKPILSKGLRVAAATVALSLILSYAWYQYRFPNWEEVVTLPDGRTVVVKERRDFIEGRGTRRTWLTFSLPEMGGEQTWSEYLYPTMIGAADGNVYVVGRPRGSTQFRLYSHPRYVYVAFKWGNGKFERLPFLSIPESIRKMENVRWCMRGGADSKNTFKEAKNWCIQRLGPDNKFPLTRIVDLPLRVLEAQFWAGLEGHQPDSE